MIILISTTYPGTTEEFIVEKIEKEKNFTIGKDFFVCFSPERVDLGNRGLAYKKDIDDPRESPAIEILKLLEKEGAEVIYYDPFLPSIQVESRTVYSQNLTRGNLAKADLVVITTDHSNVDYGWIVKHGKMVYDTRNATKNMDSEHVVLLGGYKKRSRDTKGRE